MIQNPVGYVPPVVRNLIILNIIMFLASQAMPQLYEWLALFYPTSPYFKPVQIVSYMFMHGGIGHIFFNMFSLWMFGSIMENRWGPQRFLAFYFLCGLTAAAAHWGAMAYELSQGHEEVLMIPTVGASGATVGILGAFGMTFPETRLMLLIPPIPMKAKYFVVLFGAFELITGMNGHQPGVAHFAHLGGLITGVLIVLYWRRTGQA